MQENHSLPPTTPAGEDKPHRAPVIKVIGVGGAGLQAAAAMVAAGFNGLRFAGVHTDAHRLGASTLAERTLLGGNCTRGLGAGGDPEVGRAAAEAESARLRELCAGCDLVILVTGLGKGTGSGAAPVVGRIARETGALVLALAALPFDFEGARRQQQAQAALQQLRRACDAVVCLPNQKVARLLDENTTLPETLSITNRMLVDGVRGLWRLATCDGLIKVDFADLCTVVRGRQAESCFAIAEAGGENRVRDVLDQLLASPMLDAGRALTEADAVLVSLVGGTDLRQREVGLLMEQLNRLCENAEVVMGAASEPGFDGRLSVTLIAARRGAPDRAPEADTPPADGGNRSASRPTSASAELTLEPTGETGRRGPSRFVPPPPELTPEVRDRLLRQAGIPARQRKKVRQNQQLLPLEVVSKGRFAKCDPTVHNGEDLDTPTYIRRGIALN